MPFFPGSVHQKRRCCVVFLFKCVCFLCCTAVGVHQVPRATWHYCFDWDLWVIQVLWGPLLLPGIHCQLQPSKTYKEANHTWIVDDYKLKKPQSSDHSEVIFMTFLLEWPYVCRQLWVVCWCFITHAQMHGWSQDFWKTHLIFPFTCSLVMLLGSWRSLQVHPGCLQDWPDQGSWAHLPGEQLLWCWAGQELFEGKHLACLVSLLVCFSCGSTYCFGEKRGKKVGPRDVN